MEKRKIEVTRSDARIKDRVSIEFSPNELKYLAETFYAREQMKQAYDDQKTREMHEIFKEALRLLEMEEKNGKLEDSKNNRKGS